MTDTQLYFAIGIPALLFAANILVILWQARGVERRIESLEKVMSAGFARTDSGTASLEKVMLAKFEGTREALLRVEQVMDARLSHVERP